MWDRRQVIGTAVLAPIVGLLLVIAAWAIDTGSSTGEVLRNVRLAGDDIGGLGAADLLERINEFDAGFADTVVEIDTPETTYETTAATIGLTVDTTSTVNAALAEGRTALLPVRPFGWLLSFVRHHDTRLHFQVEAEQARRTLRTLEGSAQVSPVEPTIVSTDGEPFVAVPGEPGTGIDPDVLAEALADAAEADPMADPITIELEPGSVPPRLSFDVAEAAATVANGLTDAAMSVTAGGRTITIPPNRLRQLAQVIETEESISLGLDAERTMALLDDRFGDLSTEPVDASFVVEGGTPTMVPATPGLECCQEEMVVDLERAMLRGEASVELTVPEVEPTLTTAEAEALNVVEEVGVPGNFGPKTEFVCCQPRVTNLERIADIVRGVVLRPGERFSLNDFVGPRTQDRGFVPAAALRGGEQVTEVGGGVSQFATGLFNAALWAGLDVSEHTSHLRYSQRYPRGLDATVDYPDVDLVIENPTDYGVLIWPVVDDTTLTVHLYSADHIDVEMTTPTSESTGPCTTWTTTRTRTYPDGTSAEDRFSATYLNGEGNEC